MWELSDLSLLPVEMISRQESLSIETNEFLNGIKAFDLMLKAGEGIAIHILSLQLEKVIVLAGGGNNGGDGIVAAGILADKLDVTLILVKKPKTKEAKKAYKSIQSKNIETRIFDKDISISELNELILENQVMIDAIFGVGIKSEIREPYSSIISLFNKMENIHICSIDLPSGMDCNTGEWYCEKFIPQSVVTMQHSKAGLSKLPESSQIIIADIGISNDSCYYVGNGHLRHLWPQRELDSHKGQNGRVLVIAGSDGFTGAPVLAGMATLRAGVDTLRIAVPSIIRDIVASYAEDFIVLKVRGERHTSKGFKRFRELAINRHDVIVMGMGISNHPEVTKFVRELFEFIKNKIKVVLDADAIRAFRNDLKLLQDSGAIITPHRAELRMMLEEKIPDDFNELIIFLQEKAKSLGIVILLKGRIDIITDGKRTILNRTGHSGMTVGGTGDVLAGLVGAANSFIDDSFLATAVAAYVMGKAGELAAEKYGNSLLASDVIKEIPNVLLPVEKYWSEQN